MLETRGNDFYLDGKKFNIYAGAVHYFRSFPEYWRDILLKLKLCGFNTVETYVCWNLHEMKEGEFDFSGNLDIVKFLETAKELGLYAIVRPGPYICSEWDFGGLPSWLLKDRNLRIRCMYQPYLDAVKRYYTELFRRISHLQYSNGGNIIAMQIENEYGSYGNDKNYLAYIRDLMLECGCTELLFTSDGAEDNMLSGGMLDGTLAVANFGSRVNEAFGTLRKYQPEGPLMCGEFWNGWFDHWGENAIHHSRAPEEVVAELKEMLKLDANFSFYMFHGGTNFAFNSGANNYGQYEPTVTSYDDDALLNEWGGYTRKYHEVRKVLLEHQGIAPTELPPEPELQSIGLVKLTQCASLLDSLDRIATEIESVNPECMEYYGQHGGLILYHKHLKGNYHGKLFLDGLADRAHIFINKKLAGIIYRNDENNYITIDSLEGENDIDVLVENMGRVNYGPNMLEGKGVRQIRINVQLLNNLDVYLIPLDNLERLEYSGAKSSPVFLRGSFSAEPGKGCFVNMAGFGKGYVFVNGFNLGRYWNIGPQRSLYIPGVLLKKENEIVVLELDGSTSDTVNISDRHDIGSGVSQSLLG
ncbi:MAG: beta-galactosidase [Clostridiaceae bacterium]|nr:beta-galactosidase [Clostridiaceae bacterium]